MIASREPRQIPKSTTPRDAIYGVGPDTAAQLIITAGTNPHRLRSEAALAMLCHPRTRDYVVNQLANGRSKRDILRLLKRAIAREIFRLLTQQCDIDDYSDLRPARQTKNITVTAAPRHFGVWPTVISRIERGLQRDDTLANNYRQWLAAA